MAVTKLILPRSRHSLDHRIHGFKMTRITRKLNPQIPARLCPACTDGALMILHIALVRRKAGVRRSFKHSENTLGHVTRVGVTDNIRKHIEPPAMGHANINLINPTYRRALDQLIEHRYHRLATLERKPLLPKIFFVQKLLELLGLDQFLQQLFFRFNGKRLGIDKLFTNLSPYPVLLFVAA